MNIWVMSMWVFSSLLACWSFSLLVRWVSEAVARLRKRLVSDRSTKSFWLGLVLMLVSAVAAGFAGYMAVYLEGLFTRPREQWTTPISIIGGSIGLFGIFLLILAIVGDRARGRVRCPKCWYDMSDAAGLQCPECGHTAKNKTQFGKSRRGKRVIFAGLALVLIGAYPIALNKKNAKYGSLTLVPTWVLMSGWDVFPDTWISGHQRGYNKGNLQNRLRANWISESRMERFGKKLLDPLLSDKQVRWDANRTNLLAVIYSNGSSWLDLDQEGHPSPPIDSDIDLDGLLRLAALDMLEAITTQTPTMLDDEIIDLSSDHKANIYNMAWSWVLRNGDRAFESEQYPGTLFYIEYMSSPDIHIEISGVLRDVLPEFDDGRFIELISSNDKDIRDIAFRLAIDTGLIDLKPEVFFVPDDELNLQRSKLRFHLGRALHLLTPDAQEHAFGILSQWIQSDDPGKRAFAVSSIQYLQNNVGFNESIEIDSYQRVIQDIIEYAIHDVRKPYTDKPKISIGWIAAGVITNYNTTGELSFPILLNRIDEGKSPSGSVRWPTDDPIAYDRLVEYWLDSFAEFANAENTSTRRWIINNLPTHTGTPYDDQLNSIAGEYLQDADKRVRESALRKLESRKAIELIPDEYDTDDPPGKP